MADTTAGLKDAAQALAASFEDFTGKPFTPEAVSRIRGALESVVMGPLDERTRRLHAELLHESERVRAIAIREWSEELGITEAEWLRRFRAEAIALPTNDGRIQTSVRAVERVLVSDD